MNAAPVVPAIAAAAAAAPVIAAPVVPAIAAAPVIAAPVVVAPIAVAPVAAGNGLPVFSPACASNTEIDFNTSDGKKLFNAAIAPLPIKDYEGTGTLLNVWLNDLINRLELFGWISILTVIVNGIGYFIPQSLDVTLAQVRAHSMMIMLGTNQRLKQDSVLFFNCLLASLGIDLRSKVLSCPSDYTLIVNGTPVKDGPCFLRSVLQHLHVDTMANAYYIRKQLGMLDVFMRSPDMKDASIKKFNEHVQNLVNQLTNLGGTMDDNDLLINLIKGYSAAPDSEFARQMEDKLDRIIFQHDQDLELATVMLLAEQYWTDRTNKGLWCKPTSHDQAILVMKSEIKAFQAGSNQTTPSSNGRSKYDPYAPSVAWKWASPKAGDPKSKEVNKRTFHWCPHHQNKETKKFGMWVAHDPSICKLKTNVDSSSKEAMTSSTSSVHALLSIINSYSKEE